MNRPSILPSPGSSSSRACSATIENLANDYAEILKVNQKIEASLAAQGLETHNALTAQGTLFSAVADELFRRGHGEQASNGTYRNHVPGAEANRSSDQLPTPLPTFLYMRR